MQSYKDLNIDYTIGNLYIESYGLNSLEGCPEYITGDLRCSNNYLKSLVGGPQKVDGNYWCSTNRLTDLVGCASHIGGELRCPYNPITSLIGIHKIIKSCPCICLTYRHIKQGGIGLLLIDGLTEFNFAADQRISKPFKIIQKYLGKGTKGMMECSKELISNGYALYAKL